LEVQKNSGRGVHFILFDVGNTLLYFDASWPDLMTRAAVECTRSAVEMGYRLDEIGFVKGFLEKMLEYYRRREMEFIEYTTGSILRQNFVEFGYPDIPDEHLQRALEHMYAVPQAHWHLEEDAIPTLDILKRQGYRLGLISNAADNNDLQKLIDQNSLRPFFEIILVSAEVGFRKPHPRIFQMALDHWNARPDQAMMVGDTPGADILGANRAGMVSVWITRRAQRFGRDGREDSILPEAVISTLSELPTLLAKISAGRK